LNDLERIEGYHDFVVENEQQIEQVFNSETHDVEETISTQDTLVTTTNSRSKISGSSIPLKPILFKWQHPFAIVIKETRCH